VARWVPPSQLLYCTDCTVLFLRQEERHEAEQARIRLESEAAARRKQRQQQLLTQQQEQIALVEAR